MAEALAHDVGGLREGRVGIAVAERAVARPRCEPTRRVQQRRALGQRGLDAGRHRQRLVVDEHALGGVLGEVAVARDDDADGLADVARDVDGGRVVDDARADAPKRRDASARRRRRPVTTPITPGSASAAEASMAPMRACANGERTMAAQPVFGSGSRSSMNQP